MTRFTLHGSMLASAMLFLSACAEPTTTPADQAAPESPKVGFTDVTAEAGLRGFRHVTGAFGEKWFPETMGSGGGFLDYDGDGLLDVVLVAGGIFPSRGEEAGPALRLYRNGGEGRFVEVTEVAGLADVRAYAFGVTVADYDNDGDEDIFTTTLYENLLLQNDSGVFQEIGRQAGLAGDAQWSSAAAFIDADRDGWLDIYVGNYVDWSPEKDIFCTRVAGRKAYCTPELYKGVSGRFYHNNGDGTFTDRTEAHGFTDRTGKTLGVLAVDYNRDDWPDLMVANDTQRDLLYENQGDGTFVEKGLYSGIAFDENGRARAGMGVDAGVLDTTGEVTITVGHFTSEMIGVYRHANDGFFIDRAAVSQIGRPSLRTLTFGLFLFDVDLDADLDLLAANGHITEDIELVEDGVSYRQKVQLYLNGGDARFDLFEPMETRLVARGAAYGDYDGDGDLDVLVMENGGGAYLWRNNLDDGRYLRIRLHGAQSNRSGIGARLVIQVGSRRQERYVRAGMSYLSHAQTTPVFGLADAERVDSLWVYWPSGAIDRLGSLAPNQEIRVHEGMPAP